MKWLTIDYIKQHSRIDYDYEDSLLEAYANAAEDTVLSYLNRSYQDVIEEFGEIPPAIMQATLILVDVSYTYRSPVSVTNISRIPDSFDSLVKPYMRLDGYVGGDDYTDIIMGSDAKIPVKYELPDGLTMKEVPFTVTVYNTVKKDASIEIQKSECVEENFNEYIVLVDTEELGIGIYMMKVVFQIPDSDYVKGYRKEVVKINPKIRVTG